MRRLSDEHEAVAQMASDIRMAVSAGRSEEALESLWELYELLLPHIDAEESQLFPRFTEEHVKEHIRVLQQQHQQVLDTLPPLLTADLASIAWPKVLELLASLLDHMRAEDHGLFKDARMVSAECVPAGCSPPMLHPAAGYMDTVTGATCACEGKFPSSG